MENNLKPNPPQLSGGDYKMEIQIGILGIIAGLGFFKIDELTSFVSILSNTLKTSGLAGHNLFLIVFITATILLYLLYLITFGIALIKLYKGQNILNIILYTVSFYFAMYFLIIVLMLQDPEILKEKPDFNNNENESGQIDEKSERKIENTADNIVYKTFGSQWVIERLSSYQK